MEFKSKIGTKSGPFRVAITQERVNAFQKAIFATQTHLIPPTFVTICFEGITGVLDQIGLKLNQVLHAEQEYIYYSEYQAGQTLVYESKLVHVLEKRGKSPMFFLVLQTDIQVEDEHGSLRPVSTANCTLVYKGGGE